MSAASPLFQKIFVHGSTELPAMFAMTKTPSAELPSHKKQKKVFEVCSVKETIALPPFHGARYGATASIVDGVTYIIGGADIGGNGLNNILRFGKSPLGIIYDT